MPPAIAAGAKTNIVSICDHLMPDPKKNEARAASAITTVRMTAWLVPAHGADGAEWDRALEGHSAEERRGAEIYTLEI